jgi:adenylosuccinate synthase
MGAIIIVDAFWGDSGKGKLSAYLTKKLDARFCVRAGTGINAGHSFYVGDRVYVLNQLPCGFYESKAHIRVGSGVAVYPPAFFREAKEYGLLDRAKVDRRCPIITEEYRRAEGEDEHLAGRIGSTKSGTGYALAEFRLRKAKQAKDIPELKPYLADVALEVNSACERGEKVIIECTQGTMLSLALSPDYPYVTSDNCTAMAAADDVGLNWKHIDGVIMIVKALPSRIGEGPLPYEMTREEIDRQGISEFGVTTGRKRRKASNIDWELLRYATMLNAPTEIVITFCDHLDPLAKGIRRKGDITPKIWNLIRKVEEVTNTKVTIVETGKDIQDIIEIA